MKIRRVAQRIANLKRRRLLAFQPVRIDAVYHFHLIRLAQFAHNLQCLIKIPLHRERLRAVHQRLGQLAICNLPFREKYHALDSGPRRVGRRRGTGIARARAHDDLRAARRCHAHRHRHAAILERCGGVEALAFQVELKRPANGLHEIRHAN